MRAPLGAHSSRLRTPLSTNLVSRSPLQRRNMHASGCHRWSCRPASIVQSSLDPLHALLNVILFFVKYPAPGKVKTRIATTVGAARAAEIYRRLAERVCSGLPRDAEIIVLFDPPTKRAEIQEWLTPLSPFLISSRNIPATWAPVSQQLSPPCSIRRPSRKRWRRSGATALIWTQRFLPRPGAPSIKTIA